ncbi:hypothetical protein H8356DRAFT_1658860 [Neocallimastix lanati (nom. inval.)]|uniref:B30.2/SPRY domain-containing protein n=1 Tax=Neocallimastix californiae TaxID=1754190 RepID=A0A1Y2FHJ0_9FUNG|nr:hypothetical protein H8356DRAFT_1658860 [Neocallimastix sp. JGI-2020a]ORY83431.1 hypothetical protein LY90DRAFT_499632 [Neocallimastix californiae]|eukprot:ORY83431.1 hypothetical protein LY90DRAFT_499632 [Neocallimastix californiae]
MEIKNEMIKYLEAKLKLLEIENQKLYSTIELNNKEIEQIKSLIKSLAENDSSFLDTQTTNLTQKPDDKIINLEFNWKIYDNAKMTNDLKTVRKVSGGNGWNCPAIGDKTLIKGKINKWKIQLTKRTGNIVFGIVPKEIDVSVNIFDNWKQGYITNSGNFAKHNLGVYEEFKKYNAEQGSILEIIVDLETGELSFSVNGENFGIFCNKLIKDIEYLPFIDIEVEETEITLLKSIDNNQI